MAKIEHLVVLMMENRSFDYMFGFLKSNSWPIDGLNGNETNPTARAPQFESVRTPSTPEILIRIHRTTSSASINRSLATLRAPANLPCRAS
jgi:phospholipase C